MKAPYIMTPGPTQVHEKVRMAMAKEATNSDLDPSFFEFYKESCNNLKKLFNTKNDTLILGGEGILGLEAACASLIEPGDRVLIIDNGIFGKGFADFAKIYGGQVEVYKDDYRKAIDIDKLEEFLEKDHDFKLATLVHCETPSGITNPVDEIAPLLNKYGIISVVDSVSSIGGETIKVDEWAMDIVISGSQKCISSPPGLTFISISEKAWDAILNRETPIASYYCNLAIWKDWYENKWFPYTPPTNHIYGNDIALERIIEEGTYVERHKKIAEGVRYAIQSSGLELYPLNGYSNTVSTILIPEGVDFNKIFDRMLKEHNIMIAGAFDYLADKVIRIGHMGENCYEEKLYKTLKALDETLKFLGVNIKGNIHEHFVGKLS